jgi:hypothetical protein
MTCEIIHEDVTDEDDREFIDLAHEYFQQWERQWERCRPPSTDGGRILCVYFACLPTITDVQ